MARRKNRSRGKRNTKAEHDETTITLPVRHGKSTETNTVLTAPTRTQNGRSKPFPLFKLPAEIIDQILQDVLYHPLPIPVSALFRRQNYCHPPPCDYRILHSCRALYVDGLSHYYKLNTFSISLTDFRAFPDTMRCWPMETGQANASKFIQRLHIRARDRGNWDDAVRCLRGFSGLKKIVFDTRVGNCVDEGPKGDMMWDRGWIELPACEILMLAMAAAGISIPDGGVWIGDRAVEDAEWKMNDVLVQAFKTGKEKLDMMNEGSGLWGPRDSAWAKERLAEDFYTY